MTRPKILFMPSCDGIGHAGRMLLIARALREQLDGTIEFAGNGPYGSLFPPAGFAFHEVSGGFAHDRLRFLYSRWSIRQLVGFYREERGRLRHVVEGELELYRREQPDLIVCDGRFTAPLSAWIAGVPLIGIVHPHMTPYNALEPVLPSTLPLFVRYPRLDVLSRLPRRIQAPLARHFWKGLHGLILKIYNAIVADFGAPAARSVKEACERVRAAMFPDLELTAPTTDIPKHFYYVGPLVWEPELELPPTLAALRGLIYLTMGTSGNAHAFKPLIDSLARFPEVPVVVTLARLVRPEDLAPLPDNVHVYDYLPGTEIAKRARLVICHSEPTTYQALSQGVPVISVPFNMMQELAANRIQALGAGVKLLAKDLTPERTLRTVKQILDEPSYRAAAQRIGSQFRLEDGPKRAADVIVKHLEK